jgi:peptidoglycan biosynthesis protein MviN/MurJ (putative lipid II flippase)
VSSLPQDGPPTDASPIGHRAARVDVVARHDGLVGRTALVSVLTLASRTIGFARESLAAAIFGDASAINDAFVTAWRVPNLFRSLLGEGAMSTSLQTELTRADAEGGLEAGRRLFLATARVVLVASFVLCAAVMLLVWLAPDAMPVTGWAWLGKDPGPVRELVVRMMPFVVFVCLSAAASGALFVRGRFFAPSLAPVLMNVWWITALFLVIHEFGFRHAPEAADERLRQYSIACRLAGYVLVAGAVLLLVQVPALVRERLLGSSSRTRRRGVATRELRNAAPDDPPEVAPLDIGSTDPDSHREQGDPISPGSYRKHGDPISEEELASGSSSSRRSTDAASNEHVWRVLRSAAPLALGAAVYQVNVMIDGLMAQSLLSSGGPSILYYATRVQQLPLSLISLAATSAVFPALSALGHERRLGELRALHDRTQLAVAFVALPATLGLCALAEPVMAVCFEHGAFGPDGVARGAMGLRALTLAILPAGAAGLVARTYYAMGDMRTPVKISVVVLIANVVLNAVFVRWLGMDIEGLALATGLCAWANLFLLWPGLSTRLGLPKAQSDFLIRLRRVGLGALVSTAVSWLVYQLVAGERPSTVGLGLSILVGVSAYALLAHFLRIPEWQHLWARWGRSPREA